MKRYQWYSIVILAMILLVVSSTAACAKPTPAAFEVVSLNITPGDVEVDEAISVAAEIRNTGGSTGIYTAILTINGAQTDTKSVTVVPGATETITFSLVKDKAGTYKVAIGEISSSLTVKEKQQPAPVTSLSPCTEAAEQHNSNGFDFLANGRFENAVSEFDKAIELDPSCAKAYHNRGWAYEHMAKYDLALADFDKAIQLSPNSAKTYYGRAEVYLDESLYDLAIADCNKAIQIDSCFALAYVMRAVAWAYKLIYDQALADLTKAIDLDPNCTIAYRTRATVYAKLEQWDLSAADLEKVIQVSTDPAMTEEAKRLLQGTKELIQAIEKRGNN